MASGTDFETWLKTGIESGYCTEPICATHEGIEGSDPGLTDGYGTPVEEYDEWCYFGTLLIPMSGQPEE